LSAAFNLQIPKPLICRGRREKGEGMENQGSSNLSLLILPVAAKSSEKHIEKGKRGGVAGLFFYNRI